MENKSTLNLNIISKIIKFVISVYCKRTRTISKIHPKISFCAVQESKTKTKTKTQTKSDPIPGSLVVNTLLGAPLTFRIAGHVNGNGMEMGARCVYASVRRGKSGVV